MLANAGSTAAASAPAYDVFNGDADGICALHQLRLCQPRQAALVTGVKRDVALLNQVPCGAPADITVLDVSLDANAAALHALLDGGARVRYVDHHSARQAFEHARLDLIWQDAPDMCTSLLVDRYLQGAQRPWAVVGAFGDNMDAPARQLASQAGLNSAQADQLAQLGRLLNYNAYGECQADLHLPPVALYQEVSGYPDPSDFIAGSPYYTLLADGFEDDCARMEGLRPHWQGEAGSIYLLPNQPWARRSCGIFANQLASAGRAARRSIAVLTENGNGNFVVSVRSGAPDLRCANALCQHFGGDGRKGAAGINHLPSSELARFIDLFCHHFTLNRATPSTADARQLQ